MLTLRKSDERGRGEHGWLSARHSFSFADYRDPAHTGFRDLLVINEDRVAPGKGFATHGHADMEIVTYIVEGALEHKDSTGTGAVIVPGDAQRMSAGTGIRHSEFNASTDAPVHLLQIWIHPSERGLPPSYEQAVLPPLTDRAQIDLVGSAKGDGAVTIHQDVLLWRANVPAGETLSLNIDPGRHAWIQVVRGSGWVGDLAIAAGDGVAASDEEVLTLIASEALEALVFDLR